MFAPLSAFEWEALRLSLAVSWRALLLIFTPAIGLAYLCARFRFPGRGLLRAVLLVPLVMPPVVLGYALLVVFAPAGGDGTVFGLPVAFHRNGAALAAGVAAFPLLFRSAHSAFEMVDERYVEAARSLGASPCRVFWSIVLPLSLPGVLGGVLLALGRSFGEFGATISFVASIPGETRTLPLAIYTLLQQPGGEADALRLAVISLVISLGTLWAGEALVRRIAGGESPT